MRSKWPFYNQFTNVWAMILQIRLALQNVALKAMKCYTMRHREIFRRFGLIKCL